MTTLDKMVKRSFDIFFATLGLILLSPIIFLSYIISSFETKTNGLFFQQRVGMNGGLFNIVKIKSMRLVAGLDSTITLSSDARITKSGAFFRKTKIDELPQLWNVFLGKMSFVGPRPDVPRYADRLQGKDRVILLVRPGITGPAQLAYKHEEEILSNQDDPVEHNNEVIWPDKVRINLEYIENYSFFRDVYYIWKTIIGGNVKY